MPIHNNAKVLYSPVYSLKKFLCYTLHMNNRIYIFGGISFCFVVSAILYYAYTIQISQKPLPENTTSATNIVSEIIPPIVTTATASNSNSLITITTPAPESTVRSPLSISGNARGTWYFEGSFPVTLVDEEGKIIAASIATSTGEWMTEEYIPFNATLSWASTTAKKGMLILKRDNPSGLPENDYAFSIPVIF